MTKLKEWKIY